ncbi:transcriptional activator FtrB [Phenylobacterium sp.]|uniref:transcriptional activator FtrB n=1 Tax=Phenylobacterium sp. TaxID=1871053 RepID=UPI002FC77279
MRDGDLDRVRALPLFSGCSSDTFRTLTGGAFLQRFPAGTTLLLEGDQVDFLYVLLDGIVELEGSWNDKETTLAILRPVSTFILAAVVLDADGLMSARTVERSDILMLSGAAIRRVMSEDARFAVAVAEEMAGCYRGLVRSLKNQKLRGGLERLANYLITQRHRQGADLTFTLPHEKRTLASLLGMTPENLSRSLAALADYGVEVHGPSVTITRPAALERLAKPDPLIDNHQPVSDGVTGKAQRERWPLGDGRSRAA